MPTPSKSNARKKTPAKKATPTRQKTTAYVEPEEPQTYGSGWGSTLRDVRMPSGSLAQLRRPGVAGLVAAGVIDNLDSLSALVVEKHVKRARGERIERKVDSKKVLADPKALQDVFAVMEKIVCYVVTQPRVHPVPTNSIGARIPELDRETLPDGAIWSDWVPEEDRAFIVNYAVGGTSDLAQFREEFGEMLGDVSAGKEFSL